MHRDFRRSSFRRSGADMGEDVNPSAYKILLFDGCNYRPLLFTNPLFRGLFHF